MAGYAGALRRGERVGTAHVESTVNQLINWRFCKEQQMALTKAGAQTLLQVKTALLNGDLHRYTRHIEPAAAAACPPTSYGPLIKAKLTDQTWRVHAIRKNDTGHRDPWAGRQLCQGLLCLLTISAAFRSLATTGTAHKLAALLNR